MSNSGYVLAVDVGGTNIRAAVIDSDGNILKEQRVQAVLSAADVSEGDVVNALEGALSGLVGDEEDITAIGIGFPGFFRGNSGILASSPNIPALRDFALAEAMGRRMKLPVSVQNDGLCAAIGEHQFGVGAERSNLLHITLGTGIGCGLILNNQPYAGENGMALEFGHLCVHTGDKSRLCGCGNYGCVEAYASATAISSRYAKQSGQNKDAASIYELARRADKTAIDVFEEAGTYLGLAIAEAVKLLDIHLVSISGGLTGAWPLLHAPLISALEANLISPQRGKVIVRRSSLDDNAGLLGAAKLAHNSLSQAEYVDDETLTDVDGF
jgi:glucokinase